MTPKKRDLRGGGGNEKEHPPEAFLSGFELDETLLVDGWQDYVPEAEVTFFSFFLIHCTNDGRENY